MSKRLLFINKYPDIIQEFLAAMEGRDVKIDVAANGIQAASCLKKHVYQVAVTGLSLDGYNGEQIITWLNKNFPVKIDVAANGIQAASCLKKHVYQVAVTGLSLDGYNGEQIITWLNKNFPDTLCIIYTTTISPAQLSFFFNERKVFRVFLRPVDFKREFFEALEDAFEEYEVQKAEKEEKLLHKDRVRQREQKAEKEEKLLHKDRVRQRENEILGIQQELAMRQKMWPYAGGYVERLTASLLEEYADSMSAEQKAQIREQEREVIRLCFGAMGTRTEDFGRARELAEKIKLEMKS